VVPPELGVGSLERGVTVGLGLLDTVSVVLLGLVVLGRVLGFGHGDGCCCRFGFVVLSKSSSSKALCVFAGKTF